MISLQQYLSFKNQRFFLTTFLLSFCTFVEDFLGTSAEFSFIIHGDRTAEYVRKFPFHLKYIPKAGVDNKSA
jgi:hypothetical protein